jgi:hypothetical protein
LLTFQKERFIVTTSEEIEEIHRIQEQLRQEFPTHVLKQIDRVSQELDTLRDRIVQLIKLMESKDVRG